MKTPWTRRIGRRLNMDFDYVASGGTLLMVDHVINLATSLLSLFVLTRALDKSAYGVYAYIVGVFMLMMPLTLPGVSHAMIRSIGRGYDGALRNGSKRRLLGGLVATLVAAVVAFVFYRQGYAERAVAMAAAAPLFPFAFAVDDFKSALHAKKRFAAFTVANGAVNVLSAGATVATALMGASVPVVLAANFGGRGLGNLLALWWVDRRRENVDVDPDFGSYGRNYSIIAAINSVSFSLDQVLVGSFYEMTIMASYGLATRLSEPARMIGVLVNRLAWPKAVNMSGPVATRKFLRMLVWLAVGLTLLGVVSIVLLPILLPWIFPGYDDAVPLAAVMLVSALLSVIVTYLETYFISQDRHQRFYYAATTARPVGTILLMLALMKPFGFWGLIFARLIARLASCVVLTGRMIYETHHPAPDDGASQERGE